MAVTDIIPRRHSLIETMAARWGLEPEKFAAAVAKSAMPQGFSQEEFAACLMVAHRYDLDPITKQIYFMKTRTGIIQPIVSVDGWAHIVNRNTQHDGMSFRDNLDDKGKLISITCSIRRKDRAHPVEVTEYMDECKGESPAWKKTPARMLRHRAMMQCARYAYGIAGVMDQDEFEQWQSNAPAIISEADIPKRKSSAEAKRDGTTEEFNGLRAAMESAPSRADLVALRDEHEGLINTLPHAWEKLIADTFNDRMEALSAMEAA